MKPFRQLPFEDLPEAPPRPHPYFRAEAHEARLRTDSFGTVGIHWRTAGSGPPLLLVHGLMTSGYSWRYVLEPLGRHFTLYVPDLPGMGRSEKPDRSYHPDRLADFLGELVEAWGLTGCRIVGNSLGGYLAMRLALRHPGALGPLVNLHSPGLPLRRLYALRAALSLPGSGALLRRLVHRDPVRWAHRNVHYYDERLKSLEEAREYAAPLRSTVGVQAFGRILKETLNPREMAAFLRILRARRDRGLSFPVPLLLLYADQDPMVPPRVGDALAALLPGARYQRLSEASHFAHVDAVERFLPPVLDFLAAGPGGETSAPPA